MVGGPAKANGELVDDSTPVLSGSFHGTSATALIIISRKKGLVWSSGAKKKKNKSNQRTRMQSRKTLL